MRRVVVNLVENAVQALADRDGPRSDHGDVTRAATDGFQLAVADTGPGIPAEILPKMFEPLFSTKSFGTGLGLPTVKQIVEQHGGSIFIDSTLGRGTRAAITLPQASAKVLAA